MTRSMDEEEQDMDVASSEEEEVEDEEEAAPGCLTCFSSVAAVGHVLLAEESRDLSTLLSVFLDEDSDDEKGPWGGSRPGRSGNIKRDFEGTYRRLVSFYFSGRDSLYTEAQFRRRFRVSSAIFQRVYDNLHGKGVFYAQRVEKGRAFILWSE